MLFSLSGELSTMRQESELCHPARKDSFIAAKCLSHFCLFLLFSARAGLHGRSVGFFEKREFVELLEEHQKSL